MFVLGQANTFINEQFVAVREHILIADDLAKFLDEGVYCFELLLAGCHELFQVHEKADDTLRALL
jgi:hypothetical protein